MTIYLGRVKSGQSNYAWLKPVAMTARGKSGWQKETIDVDFPSRGTVHANKGYMDGLHEGTMWIFELEENFRYEQNSASAKFNAINLKPAYILLNLPEFANKEELRRALLLGVSIRYMPSATYALWLMRTADGSAIQFAPDQLDFSKLLDGRLTVMLSQASLNESLDIVAYQLDQLPPQCVAPSYFNPEWLPATKMGYCWDSDVRFMERMVNRLPKLKRRCDQLGLSLNEATDISKAKARESIEILELSGTLGGASALDSSMLERLKELLKSIEKNEYLLDKLCEMVYDNDALEEYLQHKEQEHIKLRQAELEKKLEAEHQKLQSFQSMLEKVKVEHDTFVDQKNKVQKELEILHKEAEREIVERKECMEKVFAQRLEDTEQEIVKRKECLELEFHQFQQELQVQATSIKEQFSAKLAETLLQNQLLQIVSPISAIPATLPQANPAAVLDMSPNAIEHETGSIFIENVEEWKKMLNDGVDDFCLDQGALFMADVICRSREIPMLVGENSAWLAQCYASFFGATQVLRYTPGPATLGLEDLFYRGGTGSPTQFQICMEKAQCEPGLIHIVMLEQIYCEQAHFWLPTLARELRFGNRIPNNVVVLISASFDEDKLQPMARSSVWVVDCKEVSISSCGHLDDPRLFEEYMPGVDVSLIIPGKSRMLRKIQGVSGIQNRFRTTYGQNPEIWNRFNKVLSTAAHIDEQNMSYVSENLFLHLQDIS